MPRFYFDLHHDGTTIPDEDGQYERNARDAWNAARKVACDLMQIELDPPINWQKWHFSISERRQPDRARMPVRGSRPREAR